MAQTLEANRVASLKIRRPDDWHLHLRDGIALQAVVAATARQFARAIIMPNLREPVVSIEAAQAYHARIMAALEAQAPDADFTPLMTLYLTDRTAPSEIESGFESGLITAVKLYPAGATTNSDHGVTNLSKVSATLEAMQGCGMPLLVHGEVTAAEVDVFDREARFIDDVLIPLRQKFPELKVVFEHITTEQAAHYVRDADGPIAATITPQHLLYNRNAIFSGGLRPHWYCLPVLKREHHREALIHAATSGSERFFLGTDSAPHAATLKEHAMGCAGCYSAPYAMALYATAFDRAGRLDQLEAFASLNGPKFYGLPINETSMTLVRQANQIAESLPFGEQTIVPLAGGETLDWQVQP
ncbi:MAG: dihydroorotase [Burkholderiaceae bacterium]